MGYTTSFYWRIFLIVCVGVIIGLLIGFPLGVIGAKKIYNEEVFDAGFAVGFQYGKDSFYNPNAKG